MTPTEPTEAAEAAAPAEASEAAMPSAPAPGIRGLAAVPAPARARWSELVRLIERARAAKFVDRKSVV